MLNAGSNLCLSLHSLKKSSVITTTTTTTTTTTFIIFGSSAPLYLAKYILASGFGDLQKGWYCKCPIAILASCNPLKIWPPFSCEI